MLHTRIEDMAADYLQQIRAVQPHGPYYLGGLCAGGVLAYEVACQLQQQGQQVSMVALLDAVNPSLDKSQWIQQQRRDRFSKAICQNQSATLLDLIRKLAIMTRKANNLLRYETVSLLQRNVNAAKLRLFRYYLDQQVVPPHWLNLLSVRSVYLFAETEYRPTQKFDGQLILFRATQGEDNDRPYQEMYTEPDLGWGQRTTQTVCVHDIPGGHSSMLQHPHVHVLANILQTYLDNANLDT